MPLGPYGSFRDRRKGPARTVPPKPGGLRFGEVPPERRDKVVGGTGLAGSVREGSEAEAWRYAVSDRIRQNAFLRAVRG